jgi:hypothetical protein
MRVGLPTAGAARAACFVVVVALLALAAGGAWAFTHRPAAPAPVSGVRGPLPAGSYPKHPLEPGAEAPPFVAAGWLNGAPPSPAAARLTVVDVWAHW